ncbi:uncharacterized protein VICG_02127 [Vittaforma corneae ATCC 50505]|uniref:Sm domain-containing protein n=1 Tax=Vittaforma corneae (strain ATCC 50505) TaxID=993615 RepID=L2GIX9_VITCO|nr:uncharacterized protein VICG_02011 [Vittaforma corneae ATCC 50505]XP_007605572.1 uncharacterized protein VICG_02127 [Vittaforma corneae ATCC 50505]ELA40838.1 hypothetical protein VICG_02127 [Vittaforma corneae ATCC 50505]ELA40981.1 hypothetical protein VICG_02011 [Vittaforma corneae ATCC 50505]
MTTDPIDILKKYINENVLAGIRTGECLEGKLIGFDEHHNVLLELNSVPRFVRGEVIVYIGQKNEGKH